MDNYIVKKHWFHWVMPSIISLFLCWTIIIPIIMLGYTYLRMKFDIIEVKDGYLFSRMGLLFIDKKSIPLEQISFVSVKSDLISELLKMGTIEVQSSAFAKSINYLWIKDPDELVKFINFQKGKNN